MAERKPATGRSSSEGSAGSKVLMLLILVALLGGGYFGFIKFRDEYRDHHAKTHAVVIDLKSDTIKEIRASNQRTVTEIQKLADGAALAGGGTAPSKAVTQMTQQLTQLKSDIQIMKTEQKKLLIELSQKPAPTNQAPVVETKVVTKIARPFTKTVYFPLNKVMDPNVDNQIGQVMEALKAEAAGRTCDHEIHGFSDTLGGDKSNLELSQKRAEYVAGKLRYQDFNVTEVKAWGERRLDTHTLDGVDQVRNRRVEVEMTCQEKADAMPMADPSRPGS